MTKVRVKFEVLPYDIFYLQYKLNPFCRFLTMAVEREGRVTTQKGRTRSLHRLTEVSTLC